MNLIKVVKDRVVKMMFGSSMVPSGLVELNKYFRHYGPINFKHHNEDGMKVSVSTNFKYGSIVAHGKNDQELDKNIKDAILTSFEVPSSYKKEAAIVRGSERRNSYVLA